VLAQHPPAELARPARTLFLLRRLLCDPDGGLGDILALDLFLQFRRFLHQLAGAVCEGLGAFTFLARFFTCG
jgi:hypothetical protein